MGKGKYQSEQASYRATFTGVPVDARRGKLPKRHDLVVPAHSAEQAIAYVTARYAKVSNLRVVREGV